MRTKILIAIVAATVFAACQPNSKHYIGSFDGFVEKVERNADTYTDEDWEQADAHFEQFADTDHQKNSRKLTKEEKQKIGKLKGRYLAIRAKTEVGNFMNNLQNALDELGGVVEGFTEEITEESNNQKK